MSNLLEQITEFNKTLTYYTISPTPRALGEDGKYIEGEENVGYAVVNNETGIVEHTSTILPGVIFQAQHFDSTLKSLLEPEEEPDFSDMPTSDVTGGMSH